MSVLAPQRLTVSLQLAAGHVTGLAVRSSRRSPVQAWTVGATPDEAMLRIGRAFSLCREAQQAACALALQAAGAAPYGTPDAAQRSRIVFGELLREHACNLLLAWPGQMGEDPEPELVRLLHLHAGAPEVAMPGLRDGLARTVLGMDPAGWLALDTDGLTTWCARGTTPTARRFRDWMHGGIRAHAPGMLPPVARWSRGIALAMAAAMTADPGFGALPEWRGQPIGTGALARVGAHPLVQAWQDGAGYDAAAHMLARVVELAQASCAELPPDASIAQAWPTAPGCGLAAVETSRGILVHWLRLDRDRVADYRIVAPTEWNFHPRGLLRQSLVGGHHTTPPEARAHRWLLALDPCVDCDLELAHA
ncbi:MAG: nickel-dependent hydrogenase large subunit [Candidatus Levyibacteriota bacterium]